VSIKLDAYGFQYEGMGDAFGLPPDGMGNPLPPTPPSPPPSSSSCCGGEPYDPDTQCCENDQIVGKVSIWICNRHIPYTYPVSRLGIPFSRTLQLNHSYVCCDGANQNCYGKQSYTRKNSPVPNESRDVQGKCEEKKVCPELQRSKCGAGGKPPISSCDYWTLTGNNQWANCHQWAWEGIE